jgi:hypothetical protein
MEFTPSSSQIEDLGPVFGAPLLGENEATGLGRCYAVFPGGQVTDGHRGTILDAVSIRVADMKRDVMTSAYGSAELSSDARTPGYMFGMYLSLDL